MLAARQVFQVLPSILFIFLFSACASKQVYNASKDSGTWTAKAQAKDLTQNKTYTVSLDFLAQGEDSLRMDVTGPMGVSLATMVIDKNKVKFALYRQKKFYQGTVSDHALLPLFKINLNPKILLNICYDKVITEPDWTCVTDSQGVLDNCAKGADGLKIKWTERDGEKKRVTLTDQGYELQIVFKSFAPVDRTKVESGRNPYQLDPPNNFARYNIP